MVENEHLARFMGETSAKLDALQNMVEREFGHVKARLDKGDARFRHLESHQDERFERVEKTQAQQGKQITQIFTGLWLGRALGGAIIAALVSVLAWLGFDMPTNGK